MSLETQQTIKDLSKQYGAKNIIVILGGIDLELIDIMAETLVSGDPAFAGPLAGIPLNLMVCHIVEPELKAIISNETYQEQVGAMELAVDVQEVSKILNKWRTLAAQNN